jgi:hypothetical protein
MADHRAYVYFVDHRAYTDMIMGDTFFKDPLTSEKFYVVWCSPNNTNDAGTGDSGRLQSETISTTVWTLPTGITNVADVKTAVTIRGTVYAANTVATITVSGGTAGTDYELVNTITTATRTLSHTITIKVRNE